MKGYPAVIADIIGFSRFKQENSPDGRPQPILYMVGGYGALKPQN